MAEWSKKLSFTSVEVVLAHAVGYRFESCLRLMFFYLYSVSTNKKFSHPSYLSSWMRSCHTMVKSAVLPKTTILCNSITVITLWTPYSFVHCTVCTVYTIHSRVEWFITFFLTYTFLLFRYIVRNSIPKNRHFRPHALVFHASKRFHFQKITGTLKVNIIFRKFA